MKFIILFNLFFSLHIKEDTSKKISLPLLIQKSDREFSIIDSVILKLNDPPTKIIWLQIISRPDKFKDDNSLPDFRFAILNYNESAVDWFWSDFRYPFGYYEYKGFLIIVQNYKHGNYFFTQTKLKKDFNLDVLKQYTNYGKYGRIKEFYSGFKDGKFLKLEERIFVQ